MRRLVASALLALALGGCSVGGEETAPPQLGVGSGEEEEPVAEDLGFPAAATGNTVRIGGADPAADAAGVARALFPATVRANRPTAVVLVDRGDWRSGIAASVLASPPIGAPLLLSDGGELPTVTREALERLRPTGSDLAGDAQVIRIGGDVARPAGHEAMVIEGASPYRRAAAIDRLFAAARGEPSSNVVVYSGERAAWAMPAAAWAARSGDAALPVRRDRVPRPIRRAIREHERPNVLVLGPERVISGRVERLLGRIAGSVTRIAGPTPVRNAIAFARHRRRRFGWGVVVPGYNFVVAAADRPLDAVAAAPLATNGVFAPLLLTEAGEELPRPLEAYFLSVQPGYEDDPSQAVYNRAWILGDVEAIPVSQQARIDMVTELVPVQLSAP